MCVCVYVRIILIHEYYLNKTFVYEILKDNLWYIDR